MTGTSIADVGASGRGIRFDVRTETDATRVVVLFRQVGTANWRTLELSGSNGTWFGVAGLLASGGDNAEFFAQSVDADGTSASPATRSRTLSVDDVLDAQDGHQRPSPARWRTRPAGRRRGWNFIIQPSQHRDARNVLDQLRLPRRRTASRSTCSGGSRAHNVNGVPRAAPGDYHHRPIRGRPADEPVLPCDATRRSQRLREPQTLWTRRCTRIDVSATDALWRRSSTCDGHRRRTEVEPVVAPHRDRPEPGHLTAFDRPSSSRTVVGTPTLTVESKTPRQHRDLRVDPARRQRRPGRVDLAEIERLERATVLVDRHGFRPRFGTASASLAARRRKREPITLANGAYSDTILAEGEPRSRSRPPTTSATKPPTAPRCESTPSHRPAPSSPTTTPATGTVTGSSPQKTRHQPPPSGIAAVCVQATTSDELTADADGLYRP